MLIVVAASGEQWEELVKARPQIEWKRVHNGNEFANNKIADAYFDLTGNSRSQQYAPLKKPVIINSVIETLQELNAPENILRINGWPGFLQRPGWEIAGTVDEHTRSVFEKLGVRLHVVADEPGFIAARIIAMIVNEAYLALEDEVSSKNEIDTAMKLGTNYPFGPFEWSIAIGIENIAALLEKLNKEDSRYKPADLLLKEVNKKQHESYSEH